MENKYEVICHECGKNFMTDDEDEKFCVDCWTKVITKIIENEGKGEGE